MSILYTLFGKLGDGLRRDSGFGGRGSRSWATTNGSLQVGKKSLVEILELVGVGEHSAR